VRPVEPRDADALTAFFSDPELSRFHQPGAGGYVVERDGRVAGVGHLHASDELPGFECGWYVAREHRGTGLAQELAADLLKAGFAMAPAVFAVVDEDNARARRFAEKLGFADVGGAERHGGPHRVLVALRPSGVHHVELWVADLGAAEKTFGWLFGQLGWHEHQRWERGVSWRLGDSYVVVEDSPARRGDRHERTAPGINHLALHAGSRADVDRITAAAEDHGWTLMFADRHPHAGGPDHYAAYLENADGFEVELVARS
jgi:catechol 2,3-dioxygenase-like lactoylglutathione lyase family enzyme/L-amino acid N-acyltransferase YncA